MTDWFYNEYSHVGVDYSQDDNADVYDEQMDFRDYDAEAKAFVDKLGVDTSTMTGVDIGCGTGAFAVHASKYFKKMIAVDVSDAMQGIARSKARQEGIDNIEFVKAGFLELSLTQPADVIYTKWALHHIPDYWKQAAFIHMNRALKPDGILYLVDLVFKFDPDFEEGTQKMLHRIAAEHGTDFMEECKLHIREEYSTFDWILIGMMERAGFEVTDRLVEDDLASAFMCRKIKDV